MADQSGLPSYSDVQAAQRARTELKQNFVTLTNDQLDIQELFRSVAGQLESTPEIGEGHEVAVEWNSLRQVRTQLVVGDVWSMWSVWPVWTVLTDRGRSCPDRSRRGIGRTTESRSRTRGCARIS